MKASALIILLLCLSFRFPNSDISENIPINHLQIIGSHNSYKQSIDPILFRMIRSIDSNTAKSLDYSHISLSDQLDLGLRNLEIDIVSDTLGGKYAHPRSLNWAPGQAAYDPQGIMKEPGFKVLHVQDIDFRSNCLTFKLCLQELKKWSDSHPDHPPIFITMNAKDDAINRPPGFTIPEKFNSRIFDLLDQSLKDNLGLDHLIIPDDIRGNYPSLEMAILKGKWPSLKKARGKFIFILDENDIKRDYYMKGHPSLKGRVLFADANPGMPEAAIHIMNDAKKDKWMIQEMVKKGYIIRTRADADTQEARLNDRSTFEAALESNAQIITTDYYQKSTHFKSDYIVHFPEGGFIRENPLFKK